MAVVSRTPWCGTLTLAAPSTAYKLSDLILASANPPLTLTSAVLSAQYLSIQFDLSAGGAHLVIGNENVALTPLMCGWELIADQSAPTSMNMGANLIVLNNIYVMTDTEGVKINVAYITR